MTTVYIEVVLCPIELFAILVGRTAKANITSSTTEAHERKLGLAVAILLGQVSTLESRIAGSRRKLLELELVDALCGDEGEDEEGCESREEHGG